MRPFARAGHVRIVARASTAIFVAFVFLVGCRQRSTPNAAANGEQATNEDERQGDDAASPPPNPKPTPPPESDPLAIGSAPRPEPPPAVELDAEVDTATPDDAFWENPDEHCPKGGRLVGEQGPGKTVRCVDDKSKWNGPLARFHDNGSLATLEFQVDGRSAGRVRHWHPNGQLAHERHYRAGNLHGPSRSFRPDGTPASVEAYRVGRPWGSFVYYASDGSEAARSELPAGNGTLVKPQPDSSVGGEMASSYVHGLLHGELVRTDGDGKVVHRSQWANGTRHGREETFDAEGRPRFDGQYKLGQRHGPHRYYEDGQIARVEHFVDGQRIAAVLYQDGEPLADEPDYTADTATPEGISKLLEAAGHGPLPERRSCVQRPAHFPALIMLGSFAHDRGCMAQRYIVDGHVVDTPPPPRDLLRWSGWSDANAEHRRQLALAYVKEVDLAWSGTLVSQGEDQPVVRSDDGGGVVIEAWVRRPSGMRRGHREDHLRWTFAPAGTLARKQLTSREVGR